MTEFHFILFSFYLLICAGYASAMTDRATSANVIVKMLFFVLSLCTAVVLVPLDLGRLICNVVIVGNDDEDNNGENNNYA